MGAVAVGVCVPVVLGVVVAPIDSPQPPTDKVMTTTNAAAKISISANANLGKRRTVGRTSMVKNASLVISFTRRLLTMSNH